MATVFVTQDSRLDGLPLVGLSRVMTYVHGIHTISFTDVLAVYEILWKKTPVLFSKKEELRLGGVLTKDVNIAFSKCGRLLVQVPF